MSALLAFLLTAILAALAGALELITRHPARPMKPLETNTGRVYILVNGLAGAVALYLGVIYGILPDIFDSSIAAKDLTTAILAAGTASLVILRSSLLNVQVDGKDVNFGPSFFVTAILNVLQREVERELAPDYADVISRAQVYGFEQLVELVVPVVKNSFREEEDRKNITDTISKLKGQADSTDQDKTAELADLLYKIAGGFLLKVFDDVDKTFDPEAASKPQLEPDEWELILDAIPIEGKQTQPPPE